MRALPVFVMLASYWAVAGDLKPAANYDAQIKAVVGVLRPLLSPLHPDYQRELAINALKLKLGSESIDVKGLGREKDEYRCYLSSAEISDLVVRPNDKFPVEKNFIFTPDCNLHGKFKSGNPPVRVDFTLKNFAPYYRARFLFDYKGEILPKTGFARVNIRVLDGELYAADNEFEPEFEFLADYTFVVDDHKLTVANQGSGTIYVKAFRTKKVDRMFTLSFD